MPSAPLQTPTIPRVSIRPERVCDVVDRILDRMQRGEAVSMTETQLRSVAAGEAPPSVYFIAEAILATGLSAAELFEICMLDAA